MNFSVIIPIYNTQYLGDFFECCRQQKYESGIFELIVVDDGSEEEYTAKYKLLCDEYSDLQLQYIYMDNKNGKFRVNKARNLGASVAKFEDLIYLDGDTLIPSYYLESMKRSILERTNIDILIGESIGYNFHNDEVIDSGDIVRGNYDKYLKNPQFVDFRTSGGYKHLWWVFLGGNFHISKKTLKAIGLWNEKINNWGEDDIEFAFRAYKMYFTFAFSEGIEVYNIATGPRLTREKYYSTMQNQYMLFQYFEKDMEYLEYVLQRFYHTPQEFKLDNIPKVFQKEILTPYLSKYLALLREK